MLEDFWFRIMLKFQSWLYNNIFRKLRWFIGLTILAYLVYAVNPEALFATLKHVDFKYIPLWVAIYLISLIVGTFNLYLLLRPFTNVKYSTLLQYDIVATSFGYFTPAQLGTPISLAMNLRQEEVKLPQSTSAFLLDKLITLLIACGLGSIGVYNALDDAPIHFSFANSISIFAYLIMILLVVGFLYFSTRKFSLSERLRKLFREILSSLLSYRHQKRYLFINIMTTFVVQCVLSMTWIVSFQAIGKGVHLGAMVTTVPAINVIAYLPITAGGIGTQEFGAIALWKHVGISGGEALSAFVFSRVLTLLTSLVFLSLNLQLWPKIDH